MRVDLQVELVNPAFLGDARQQGAWRTPPFKALLRQWWRVAAAARLDYDWEDVREEEGRLFGHAALKDRGASWAMRSRVQVRLGDWGPGRLTEWRGERPVPHPEVQHGRDVGAHLYLGYGPLEYRQGGTALKHRCALDAREKRTLTIAFPGAHRSTLQRVVQLVAWFGAVGGRSRNGWGSVKLTGPGILEPAGLLDGTATAGVHLSGLARPLSACLELDWPHALGADASGLLLWRTRRPFPGWQEAMQELARVKIAFRTALPVEPGLNERHLLAYPVTHHSPLHREARLANQLRFRLHHTRAGFVGIAYHLPCAFPEGLERQLRESMGRRRQAQVWQKVHHTLDTEMARI